jgi:carboxyl-terminal processing protease
MGVPPVGAAAAKPLVAHRPWSHVVSSKTRGVQSRTRTSVSASRGTASRAHSGGGSSDGDVAETESDDPSSSPDFPLSGIARHAAAALVSAAAASCVLLGEGLPSGSAVAAFVGGVVTGGVPVAYADEDAREDALAAADAPAPAARDDDAPAPAAATDLQIVDEVWKVVDENFLPARAADGFDRARWARLREEYTKHPPVTRAEAYDVIRDILRTLGDPFSRFVDPAAFAPLLKYDISGVGLNIAEDADDGSRLRVLGLVLDSPAARAGVKQGDELVSVDGVATRNKSAFQAVSLIQASADADVAVGVRSSDDEETRVVTLRRSVSASDPVASRMEGGNVGYIRLKEFNALAEPNVARAIETLRGKGATSFVLDLRDNPGGLVQAGVEIARLFLPPNTAVAYTEGRVVAGGVKGDTQVAATVGSTSRMNAAQMNAAPTRLKSIPSATAASVTEPLTVLVNGRSASASEILTGALRDNCRATVAGSRTYGKGLIQSVYELSDGSGLVLTVGKYVTPGLHDIDRAGIDPDFAMFPGFEKAGETLDACRVPQSK